MTEEFDHGHEPRAEEIALHQRFLTLLGQMEAAQAEGNETEVRRLDPLLERARKRWLAANHPCHPRTLSLRSSFLIFARKGATTRRLPASEVRRSLTA
jgi:hypothetical protein